MGLTQWHIKKEKETIVHSEFGVGPVSMHTGSRSGTI